MQVPQQETTGDKPMTLGGLLGSCSTELANSARSCTELQWVITRLLERSKHPDLAAEMHVLQDIDRLQQTLADLACLFEAVATLRPEVEIDTDTVLNTMRLPSLRNRLCDRDSAGGDKDTAMTQGNDISWL